MTVIKNVDKKKIIFVLPSLAAGGAERVLINLMNGLNRDYFQPSILSVSDRGELHDLIDSDIPYYSLGRDSVLKSPQALYLSLIHI